jgi:hypothetical protein
VQPSPKKYAVYFVFFQHLKYLETVYERSILNLFAYLFWQLKTILKRQHHEIFNPDGGFGPTTAFPI